MARYIAHAVNISGRLAGASAIIDSTHTYVSLERRGAGSSGRLPVPLALSGDIFGKVHSDMPVVTWEVCVTLAGDDRSNRSVIGEYHTIHSVDD